MPCFGLMRIVQLLTHQYQLVLNKGCVEPEVERRFFVAFGHAFTTGLKQYPYVANQLGAIDQGDGQNVFFGVVLCMAIAPETDMSAKDLIAAALIHVEPKITAIALLRVVIL